jgi:outer membrane protein assembly factor BamB
MCRNAFAIVACFCFLPTAIGDTNWPQFRGTTAGVSDDAKLPAEWSPTKNVAWVVDVPGRGWSSPVVWGNRVFLTSVVKEGNYEEARKGLYFGGERAKPADVVHHWRVYCFDLMTGKKVWEQEVGSAKPDRGIHIKNTYASETPVTDGERLYAYFGNMGLFCYSLDGKLLWKKTWPSVRTRFSWGTAASPVVHKGRIYILNDNEDKSFLEAIDAKTGEVVWHVNRDEKSNWATPFIWEHDGRTEVVTAGTSRVRSYDLEGKVLWELGGMSSITIPTPFARHGLLYIGSGYVMDKTRPIYAIRPGATGDISLKPGQTTSDQIAWSQNAAPYNPTPLVYGDYLYVLYDRGMISCYEAKSGKPVYERERLDGMFTSSPWAYGGKVYCLNEDGTTYVVQAGPKFQILGKNRLEEMAMATPALAGDRLLIRTLTKLYCFRNP